MNAIIIIALLTCIGLLALVLCKPNIEIKGHSVSIYWTVSLFSALLLIASGLLPLNEAIAGLTADTSINPLKILVLFLSMTALSVFLDELGFFRYMAGIVLNKAKTSQKILFFYLYLTVSVLTVFTSNDIIILTFTPFICYFAKSAKINPIPYLFVEFVAANTWSMMLVIGNPTNVYLSASNDIGFLEYTSVMLLPTIAAGVVAYLVLILIFRRSLNQPIQAESSRMHITKKPLLVIGILHLSLCTVLLVISSYIGLEMWLITFLFAISLFVCSLICKLITKDRGRELSNVAKRVPWELVPFVLSMFILVLALDKYGVTEKISLALDFNEKLTNSVYVADASYANTAVSGSNATAAAPVSTTSLVLTYGGASFLTANLINNIPMSVLFASVTESLQGVAHSAAVYSSIIGSNIGAFFTPIGALAGIMWSAVLKKHQVNFSFLTFLRYGSLLAVPTLLAALLVLALRLGS